MTKSERLIVREVKCFMCGCLLGELLANAAHRFFRSNPNVPLGLEGASQLSLSKLRCPRCGGPAYLDGAETTTRWFGETILKRTANRR